MITLSRTSATPRGGFADILDYDSDSVVKLFRRMEVTHVPIERPEDNDVVIRAVWDAEAEAYEIAARSAELRAHLPSFFGRLVVDEVIGPDGTSVAAEYLLDCGFRMAGVPGSDSKVACLQHHPLFPAIDGFLDYIYEGGIKHPYDGSVFIPGLANGFTVIDVASWDAMAELGSALAFSGRLTDRARAKWGPRVA